MNYKSEHGVRRNTFNHEIIQYTERRIYDNGDVQELTSSVSYEGLRMAATIGMWEIDHRDQALAAIPAGWCCPDGYSAEEHSFECNDHAFDYGAVQRGEGEPVFILCGWGHWGEGWLCVPGTWTKSNGWDFLSEVARDQ